jgi:hyperosmotically inducible periplasmic protein
MSQFRKLAVVALLAGTLGACAVVEGKQTAGQYTDDATISTRVRTEIVRDADLSLNELNVETQNGTVQLSGFTNSQAKAAKAGQIARATPGVKDVRNNIIVKP